MKRGDIVVLAYPQSKEDKETVRVGIVIRMESSGFLPAAVVYWGPDFPEEREWPEQLKVVK